MHNLSELFIKCLIQNKFSKRDKYNISKTVNFTMFLKHSKYNISNLLYS